MQYHCRLCTQRWTTPRFHFIIYKDNEKEPRKNTRNDDVSTQKYCSRTRCRHSEILTSQLALLGLLKLVDILYMLSLLLIMPEPDSIWFIKFRVILNKLTTIHYLSVFDSLIWSRTMSQGSVRGGGWRGGGGRGRGRWNGGRGSLRGNAGRGGAWRGRGRGQGQYNHQHQGHLNVSLPGHSQGEIQASRSCQCQPTRSLTRWETSLKAMSVSVYQVTRWGNNLQGHINVSLLGRSQGD